jgi:glycosyltransferase involved in cell wall biosynthesis
MNRQSPVVVIVRDRASSGGGIYNYYSVIAPHLNGQIAFCDSGKPYVFYGDHKSPGSWLLDFTPVRLFLDWMALVIRILRLWPDVVLLNPCLDPPTYRSMRRDAVNVLICRFFRRRVVSFWRGWENAYSGQPEFPGGNKSLLCRIYKMADVQIVLSDRFKTDLLRWGFRGSVHVETTVVGDECLAATPTAPSGRVPTNLLYLSRVEVAKGVFELLDAYKILKARNPAFTLTIAGDGPDLEALKQYAKELDLPDIGFTGFVVGTAKTACFRQAGVFCFLSYTEGMPNAVLEAFAAGLPVVSSDAGGLRDILRNRETGIVVRPLEGDAPLRKKFDPVEVANAIERLVDEPGLHQRITNFNWQYARDRFAAGVVAKRLEDIYQSVLADEPARSESAKPVCVE